MSFGQKGFMLSQSGGKALATKVFEVETSTKFGYFIGDAVILQAGTGLINPLPTSAPAGLGVITALYKKVNNDLHPLTFNQPGAGPYLTSGQAGFAQVVYDGAAVYVAQLDTTASVGLIGKNVRSSAGAANLAAGISGMNLKGTSIATSTNRSFKILGLANTEMINGRSTDKASGSGVFVKLNNPQLNQTAGV